MNTVFLDQDGPTIPSYMYVLHKNPSFERKFSPVVIPLLNWLCKSANAQIVCNSAHNYYDRYDVDEEGLTGNGTFSLKDDLILAGLEKHHLHSDWRTEYGKSTQSRMDAITMWTTKHRDPAMAPIEWVCFDDFEFTKDPRLILVDFDDGLNLRHCNMALEQFGRPGKFIL